MNFFDLKFLRRAASFFTALSLLFANSFSFAEAASIIKQNIGITATGGTITTVVQSGTTYKVHTFTSSGTFTVTRGSGKAWYLVVGGGGGGGYGESVSAGDGGGGGGAGGYRTNGTYDFPVTAQSYTITVGAGGAGGVEPTSPADPGGDSVFSSITSTGGGRGGNDDNNGAGPGNGGSGGGGGGICTYGSSISGGTGTAGQGNAGGTSTKSGCGYRGASGGGGASAAGTGSTGSAGVAGGAGSSSSITGASVSYAGGGGGGGGANSAGGAGGTGGGGTGGTASGNGLGGSGTANTGGGGGGAGASGGNRNGGSGGSGVVIIRYAIGKQAIKNVEKDSPIVATGGTITTVGNRKVHTFTSSGTFTVTSGSGKVWYLVVGGGGGGRTNVGGGGGAGGYRTNNTFTYPVSTGSYTVTVGAGGGSGADGSNSVFDAITATGGGKGGPWGNTPASDGSSGGSGGGGGSSNAGQWGVGGAGTAGQGNNGGNGAGGAGTNAAGGGGGAGAVGATATASNGGAGGAGTASTITGSSVTRASGGGGGGQTTGGSGGAGGGGAGGAGSGIGGTAATANTGGGGGGGSPDNGAGSAGGSGIVVISYVTNKEIVAKSPPSLGLVGWWPFDSRDVNDKIYDRSGKANNGYLYNGATTTAHVTGRLGKAMKFLGGTDHVEVPPVNISTGNITISAWVYSSNFNQAGAIVYKKPVNTQWSLFFDDCTTKGLTMDGGAHTTTCRTDQHSPMCPSNNAWHHIAGTINGTTCRVYVDGEQWATGTVSGIGNSNTPGTNNVLFSTYDGTNYPFNGIIDDVRIYDRSLSAAEVLNLYRSK